MATVKWTDAWYLLRCREKLWKTTLDNLSEAGIKTCCPLIHERRQRSDKKNAFRTIQTPLFPGYIFVRFNPMKIHTTAIKRMPGVMYFVHFGNKPATVHPREIEALEYANPAVLSADSFRYECIHLPESLIKKVEEIYTKEVPAHRVNLLFSLLALPARLLTG